MVTQRFYFWICLVFIALIAGCSARDEPVFIHNEAPYTSEFVSEAYFNELEQWFNDTKKAHDRWHNWDNAEHIAAESVITMMMQDLLNNPEALLDHPHFNQYFETFDHYIRKLDRISEEMHYFRNTLNSYSDAPASLDEMITLAASGEWKLFSARYHRYDYEDLNGAYNVKFISKDGRFEAVYNTESGQIVLDPVNMGTYNYASGSIHPVKYYQHNKYDKVPWKQWGNTKEVPYEEIGRMPSKQGTKEEKLNSGKVEQWIEERKASIQAG